MGYNRLYPIHGSLRSILDRVTGDQLPAIKTLIYEPSHEDEPHYEKSFWKIKEEQTRSNAPNMFNNYKCPLVKDDTSLDPDDDFEEI
ncbi:MAG: hypothetical protein IKE01_05605 [Clostridia bacterium]|nr:hypothetical protein [Clostridia bacterium]